jgi:hypothetical protein
MNRILIFALLLFVLSLTGNCFAGTWTRVNGCGQETASVATANCVVTGTSVGDFMLVGIDCGTTSTTATVTVSDTANTFTVRTGGTNGFAWNGTADRAWSYTSVLTTGGSRTVTVTASLTCTFHDIWVDVWHNTAGVSTINTPATASGTNLLPTVNITSVGSNDLIVGFFSTTGTALAAGSGYTLGANGNAASVAMGNEYKLGAAAGTQTVNGTLTGATTWGVHAISVQEVSNVTPFVTSTTGGISTISGSATVK